MRLQEPPIAADTSHSDDSAAPMTLTPDESEHLAQIVARFTPAQQERYLILTEKLEDEMLTPVKHEELIALTHHAEAINVARLTLLAEIGERRNLPLPRVMALLKIGPIA